MTVPVIYLDEHEVNEVADMLGEISSLEEQKEDLEKKKEKTSNKLNIYAMDLFDKKSDVYKKRREGYNSIGKPLGPLPFPAISDDLKSLVLLSDEKEDPIYIVYLNGEESKRIAGLMGRIRSLGEQVKDASRRAGMKERELRERIYAIAKERSEMYQKYTFNSGSSTQPDIRPVLTDDGKAIVIRHFRHTGPRPMF